MPRNQNTQERAKREERDRRPGRRLIRPREAWQRLGCGHTKFYELVGAGRIRLVQLSPRITAVVEDELDDLIDELVEARDEKSAGPSLNQIPDDLSIPTCLKRTCP